VVPSQAKAHRLCRLQRLPQTVTAQDKESVATLHGSKCLCVCACVCARACACVCVRACQGRRTAVGLGAEQGGPPSGLRLQA